MLHRLALLLGVTLLGSACASQDKETSNGETSDKDSDVASKDKPEKPTEDEEDSGTSPAPEEPDPNNEGQCDGGCESEEQPEELNCGEVGQSCQESDECPDGMKCEASLCAPVTGRCGIPPDGSLCPLNESCLLRNGTRSGICVSNDDLECLCQADVRRNFYCQR